MSPSAGIWDRVAARAREAGTAEADGGGVWKLVTAQLDPSEFRPRLAEDVELKEFQLRWGNDYAMLANPRDLIHYRLEPDEVETIRLMDGTRTIEEIVIERFRESGDLELERVAELVRQLRVGGFLDSPYIDTHEAVRKAPDRSVVREKFRRFTTTLQVEWKGADRFFRWLYRRGFRFFFTPWVAGLGLLFAVLGIIAFVSVVRSGRFSLSTQSLALEFVILGTLNYFLTFTHETGHALATIHHGRRLKAAGFMIYYGSPAWFIDASDALMSDRKKRIVQSFAGPFAELVVAGIASALVWAFPGSLLSVTLYKFAVLNYFVIFMNLVPLLELDGYYILADLIQVPDLRPRSLAFIRYDLWHKLRIRERLNLQEVGLTLYGVLGILFAVVSLYASYFFWRRIFGKLIISMWNGGTLTRILLVLLALLVAGPLVRAAIGLLRTVYRRGRALGRAIRFRLERGWRIEAAELIDALPLFEEVPVEVLNDLAGRVRLRTMSRGQPVFRQGERADAFYVVRQGSLQVVEENPQTGEERILRTLERGASFGELGLLESSPRAATVRALEESELFVVEKGTFDQLLADMASVPQFAPTLQAVAELQALPPFSTMSATQLAELLESGRWVNVAPGEAIVEEGEPGDAFYAIRSGQVDVIRGGATVSMLGAGSFFGEIALLEDVPRTATVRARTPVRAFRLEREGFARLVRDAFRAGTLKPHALVSRSQEH
jgi:CRP-like cAMP-binding protein/Zn-dependent protease